jgi:hypothetical protein
MLLINPETYTISTDIDSLTDVYNECKRLWVANLCYTQYPFPFTDDNIIWMIVFHNPKTGAFISTTLAKDINTMLGQSRWKAIDTILEDHASGNQRFPEEKEPPYPKDTACYYCNYSEEHKSLLREICKLCIHNRNWKPPQTYYDSK